MAPIAPEPGKTERRSRGASTVGGALPPPVAAVRRSRTGMLAGIGLVAVLAIGAGLYALLGGKPARSEPPATVASAAVKAPAAHGVGAGAGGQSRYRSQCRCRCPCRRRCRNGRRRSNLPRPTPSIRAVNSSGWSASQSPGFKVEAEADKPQIRIDKDLMTFKVRSDQDGYLYVLQHGTDGGIVQVFPECRGQEQSHPAGAVLSLPPKGMTGTMAGGPAGTDHLMAIVSRFPRDFPASA